MDKGFCADRTVGGSCLNGHMDVVAVEDMAGGELLDHVSDLAATQRRCEVEILRAAVQHAYLNDRDSLDPDEFHKPGRERARRLGGAGTPEVTEFAAASLGARLGMSTVSAGLLMADGLDLCHRLPQLWAPGRGRRVRVYLARLVARKSRDLTPEQASYVDSRVTPYADGRLTWSRFQALVDGAVAAADPDATAERETKGRRAAGRASDPSRGRRPRHARLLHPRVRPGHQAPRRHARPPGAAPRRPRRRRPAREAPSQSTRAAVPTRRRLDG